MDGNEIQLLQRTFQLPGNVARHDLLVERVERTDPPDRLKAGIPGALVELVHQRRIDHKAGNARSVGEALCQLASQVGGMLRVLSAAAVGKHRLVDGEDAAAHRAQCAAAADYGIHVGYRNAVFPQGVGDHIVAVLQLPLHIPHLFEILVGVGDVGDENFFVLVENGNPGGSGPGIDAKDLHSASSLP